MKLKVNTGTPSSPQWTAVDAENADTLNSKSASMIVSEAVTKANTSVGTLSNLKTTNKSNIVSAMNELFTSASDGKTAISSAITRKGVTSTTADTFASMASKIDSIPEGYASGTKLALGRDIQKEPASLTFEKTTVSPYATEYLYESTSKRIFVNYLSMMSNGLAGYQDNLDNKLFDIKKYYKAIFLGSDNKIYAFNGSTNDVYDINGQLLLTRTLPFTYGLAILMDKEGNFIAVSSYGAIQKYDKDLNLLWSLANTNTKAGMAYCCCTDDDGNIFIGYAITAATTPAIVSISSVGKVKWSSVLTDDRSSKNVTNIIASNGYVTGATTSFVQCIEISTGKRVWSDAITNTSGISPENISIGPEGRFVLSSCIDNPYPTANTIGNLAGIKIYNTDGSTYLLATNKCDKCLYVDDDHFYGSAGNNSNYYNVEQYKIKPEYYTVI